MKRILLTGGRAPVTLDLARNLHQAGHEVLVAESWPYHLCRVSRAVAKAIAVPAPRQHAEGFVAALKDIVVENKVDLLIPTCEEVFYVARGFAELSPHTTVFVAPLAPMLQLHHKARFIELVKRMELPVPRTWCATSVEDLHTIFNTLPRGSQWVLKPAYSRFGTQVRFLWPEDPIPNVEISDDQAWLVQEYIAGRALSTYSIARQGRLQAHATYHTSYTAGLGASIYFEPLDEPRVKTWVESFVREQNYTGQIGFDFVESPEGVLYPLECNPRTTSGLHLLTGHRDLWTAFEGGRTELLEPPPGIRKMLATAMLAYAIPKDRNRSAWWRAFVRARDVVFRWSDPLPGLWQLISMTALWQLSRKHGISLVEASTLDIEWNSER